MSGHRRRRAIFCRHELKRIRAGLSVRSALRIALVYALFGILWIASSDRLLAFLVSDPRRLTSIQTYKGVAFIAWSALLLYLVARRELGARARVEAELDRTRERALAAEVEKKQFSQEVIRAVTHGRLRLVDPIEIPLEGELALQMSLDGPGCYPVVRERLLEIAQEAGLDPDRAGDLLMAAGEAITNAMKHGADGCCAVYRTGDRLIVRVSDRGRGIRADDLPAALLLPGFSTGHSLGAGFTIMLKLADRIWLATGTEGTVVQLEMWIKPLHLPEALAEAVRRA